MRTTIQSQAAQSEDQAAPSSVKSTPAPTRSQRAFLVVVMDEADGTCCGSVVRAADEEAAAQQALQGCKAEHGLGDLDDQAAGFKVVAVYSQEDVVRILSVMELPELDL